MRNIHEGQWEYFLKPAYLGIDEYCKLCKQRLKLK